MKLPGINYNTPTQSLGKEDINAPFAIAAAETRAMNNAVRIGQNAMLGATDANKTAIDAARFQQGFADINAIIKGKKSYTVDELDQLEIKYDDKKYGVDKIEEVPAYMVSTQIYKRMTEELYQASVSSTSAKGGVVISKMYGQMYKEGIAPIVANSIKDANDRQMVDNEIAFNAAADAGNGEAATMIAETARETSQWSEEKYLAMTKDMPDRVAKGKYLGNLNATDDLQGLNSSIDILLDDPDMKPGTKSAMYKMYESKISKVETANEKALKEQTDKDSYDVFIDSATGIIDDGSPMDWNELNTIAHGLNPTDGKGLITINRLAASKGTTTDPKKFSSLMVQVKRLSIPRDNTTIFQRRKTMIDDLDRAAGFDPITGEQVGTSSISAQDYATIFDSINKSQGFAYDNPEVKNKADVIWKTLTGGSKDLMTSLFGAGADTLNAVEAEDAMLKAARDSGPGFNPDAWWELNGDKYITASIEENEKDMADNRIDKYIIRGSLQDGGINLTDTAKNINNRIKDGTLSVVDGNEAMRQIRSLQLKKKERYERSAKKEGNK